MTTSMSGPTVDPSTSSSGRFNIGDT